MSRAEMLTKLAQEIEAAEGRRSRLEQHLTEAVEQVGRLRADYGDAQRQLEELLSAYRRAAAAG